MPVNVHKLAVSAALPAAVVAFAFAWTLNEQSVIYRGAAQRALKNNAAQQHVTVHDLETRAKTCDRFNDGTNDGFAKAANCRTVQLYGNHMESALRTEGMFYFAGVAAMVTGAGIAAALAVYGLALLVRFFGFIWWPWVSR